MGHSAYMRGSRAIAAQFCRDRKCSGCEWCRPEGHKATPRPADWGSKTAARASASAAKILAAAERYGLPRPSEDVLALAVQTATGVSRSSAKIAARSALMES